MSQTTLPSASQHSGADGVRIKRLERELAESKSMHSQVHGKALDDIDSYEAETERLKATIGLKERVIKDLIGAKDRYAAEIEADYAKRFRPTGSGNEKDDEVIKQFQDKILELQSTVTAKDAESEKLREQNGELQERIQMLESQLPRVLSYAKQCHADADSSAVRVARQVRIARRAMDLMEDDEGLSQHRNELLAELSEESILNPADVGLRKGIAPPATKAGLHISGSEVQRSGNSNAPPAPTDPTLNANAKVISLAWPSESSSSPASTMSTTPSDDEQIGGAKRLRQPETPSASSPVKKKLKTTAEVVATAPYRELSEPEKQMKRYFAADP